MTELSRMRAALHPSADHYRPLLYAVGASLPSDSLSFPVIGFDLSSISMRSVLFS